MSEIEELRAENTRLRQLLESAPRRMCESMITYAESIGYPIEDLAESIGCTKEDAIEKVIAVFLAGGSNESIS